MPSYLPGRYARVARSGRYPPRSARPTAPRRAWRRRGRKAQASAVATILGLLLVVTYIANYLTTTLPQYMTVNDVEHDDLVQNQVGRLAALIAAASAKNATGALLTQPIALGSAGLPPFAQPDGAAIGPINNGTKETVTFKLTGPTTELIDQQSLGAGLIVQLHNLYTPYADVAFDNGGVVFAQQAGIPEMLDPPPITIGGTSAAGFSAAIRMPIFTSQIPHEGGIGTAIVQVQLLHEQTQAFPNGGLTIASNTVTVTLTSPFSGAWYSYFKEYFAGIKGFTGTAACAPSSSSVCSTTGIWAINGPLGTVTLTLPVTHVTFYVDTFSIGLT